MSRATQLELEKIINELAQLVNETEELKNNKKLEHSTRKYYTGLCEGYLHAKEECERLMEVVTQVYPESRMEDI